jgi:lipopolysaccharide export system permease protein
MIRIRIDRHIAGSFLAGAAPALLVLLGLFSFIGLTEELEDVGKGSFLASDAVVIVLMSLPVRIIELAPVSALMGTLIGLGTLANHQEVIVLRAAGLSPWRLAAPLAVAAVALAVAVLLMQGLLVPGIERETARLHAKASRGGGDAIWLHGDRSFVRISGGVSGRTLVDVEIHELDKRHALARTLRAERVEVLADGRWLLQEVHETVLGEGPPTDSSSAGRYWQSPFSPEQTETLVVPVEALSLGELRRLTEVLAANGLDTHRYRVLFWQQLGVPVGLLGMAMLGLPLLLGPVRATPIAQRVALGAATGIVFYLVEQLSGHGAVIYRLNPVITTVGPDVLLLGSALFLVSRAEQHQTLILGWRRLRLAVTRTRIYTPKERRH